MYGYQVFGQAGRVLLIADDIVAPDDEEIRAVLRSMEERYAADRHELSWRVGRIAVEIQPSKGGGLMAVRAAMYQLRQKHGTGVTPD